MYFESTNQSLLKMFAVDLLIKHSSIVIKLAGNETSFVTDDCSKDSNLCSGTHTNFYQHKSFA